MHKLILLAHKPGHIRHTHVNIWYTFRAIARASARISSIDVEGVNVFTLTGEVKPMGKRKNNVFLNIEKQLVLLPESLKDPEKNER